MASTAEIGLVGDIGATNARFALVDATGRVGEPRAYRLERHHSIEEMLDDFLGGVRPRPRAAVLAVAAPMLGDQITLTNRAWSFSTAALKQRFGFARLRVLNDFAANAMAIPLLGEGECMKVGGGAPADGGAIGVIGPGTGLGVSGLATGAGGPAVLEGEGGHVTMPAVDEREAAVVAWVRRRYGHASAERFLSGPGLVNIYTALRELAGLPAASLAPSQVTDANVGASDACAREATEMFCAMLGTVAGNLALTLGARVGVYIAGGIVPKLGAAFTSSRFRERFEAKGRLAPYVAAIPTFVIMRPLPALLGAAALLRR